MDQQSKTFNDLGDYLISKYPEKIKLSKESFSSLVQQFADTNKSEEVKKVFYAGQTLDAKILSKHILSLIGDFLFDQCQETNQILMIKEDFASILQKFELNQNIKQSQQNVKKYEQSAVQVKVNKHIKGAKKLDKSSISESKIQKIKDVLEKKTKAQLDMIEKYQNFKVQLEKNMNGENSDEDATDDDEEQLKNTKRFPCFDEKCYKRYESDKTRKYHIIKKHLIVVVERKHIKYLCSICEKLGTNSPFELEQHEDGCAKEYAANLELEGVKFEQKKLSKEQKKLQKEAKKFC